MIDFRYHIVSLVSVFMALAIGVVLGAGPLKEAIGDQLSNQVEGLRADTADLQQAVANREEQIAERDTFIDGVTESLTAGRLSGTSVVLVLLPGADGETADALGERLAGAGATLTGRVTLQPRWTDPEQQAFRSSLTGQLVQYVEPRPDTATGATGELAAVLARAVVTTDVVGAGEPDPDAATVLEGLRAGELVTVDGDPAQGASTAVVLTGAPDDAAGAGDEDWTDAAHQSYAALATALDDASRGAVVAGPVSSAADPAGLLTAFRDNGSLTESVSTVDSVDTPMGRATTVLALSEQLAGGVGQYGVAENAVAPLPTPSEPSSEPSADAAPTEGGG